MLHVIVSTEKISPQHVRRWMGVLVPTQEKKTLDLRKLGNIRKVSKPHRMIAQCPAPSPHKNETPHTTKKKPKIAIIPFPRFATPHSNYS